MRSVSALDHCDLEQRFVLDLIGVHHASAAPALEQMATQVDWEHVLTITPPPLYPYVDHCLTTALSAVRVPERVRSVFAQATRTNAMLHLQRRLALRDMLHALERHSIPVMLLKGAILAHQIYPTPSTRTMDDLDVLVPQPRIHAALAALQEIGFGFPERYHDAYRTLAQAAEPPDVTWPLQRPDQPIFVELHTSIDFARTLPAGHLEAMWARSVATSVGGLACRMLHHDDFLMHLCLHLSRYHKFQPGMRALLDIALYVAHYAAVWDWPALATASQHQGTASWLYVTLHLAHTLLGAPVPPSFFAQLSPPAHLHEVERLAIAQCWEATQHIVPKGFYVFKTTPLRQLPRFVWQRLHAWSQEDLEGMSSPRRLARMLRTASRHLYRMHLVPLWQARARGTLSIKHFDRAATLQRGREHMEALMTTHDHTQGHV